MDDIDDLARLAAHVGTELWREVSRRMRILEGDEWARGDDDAELIASEDGRFVWTVGGREFGWFSMSRPELIACVDAEKETAMLVDAEGVIVDRFRYVRPSLN